VVQGVRACGERGGEELLAEFWGGFAWVSADDAVGGQGRVVGGPGPGDATIENGAADRLALAGVGKCLARQEVHSDPVGVEGEHEGGLQDSGMHLWEFSVDRDAASGECGGVEDAGSDAVDVAELVDERLQHASVAAVAIDEEHAPDGCGADVLLHECTDQRGVQVEV
jgi:hypothetical protein